MNTSAFRWAVALLCIFGTGLALTTYACTGLMLKTKDNNFVHGRTAEFGYFIDTDIVVTPRNYSVTGNTAHGPGMPFKTKYSSVGTIAFGVPGYLDGMNEKGLSGGAFYFPGYAGYAKTDSSNKHKALSQSQFMSWALGQFKNIDELQKAIKNNEVVVTGFIVKGFGDEAPPFKYVFYDTSGKSIVVEPLNGELVVYDNPFGSMANSPTHDWHLTNLNNYIALDANNQEALNINGTKLSAFGQGSGMLGLPGDFTPPSRFVRATVFSLTAIPSANSEDGVKQVFHLLNNFDIPVGIAREEVAGKILSDYTMITVARDPKELKYYWKTYEDQTIRVVDLKSFDPNNNKVIKLSTGKTKQGFVDMSAQLM
ncbi:linear amide C-N hydrolase [Agaribacterium haliotis]|uniref:linear amide C-N hydrolase n=1 Tax=Agaribacterium haliotis TaxID=2013869 RepID=UPI00195CC572|nr:choloylglycine hydrolase family protein [Agaribacterium haliotis]